MASFIKEGPLEELTGVVLLLIHVQLDWDVSQAAGTRGAAGSGKSRDYHRSGKWLQLGLHMVLFPEMMLITHEESGGNIRSTLTKLNGFMEVYLMSYLLIVMI